METFKLRQAAAAAAAWDDPYQAGKIIRMTREQAIALGIIQQDSTGEPVIIIVD